MKIISTAILICLFLSMPTQVVRGENSAEAVLIIVSSKKLDIGTFKDPKEVKLFEDAFNEYLKSVGQNIDMQLHQLSIKSRMYYHQDQSKSVNKSVFEMIKEERYCGIIQLSLIITKYGLDLSADYLKVCYSPLEGGGSYGVFEMGYEEQYRVMTPGLRRTPTASEIATKFVQKLRQKVFRKP